jgi:hypothetical protein
MPMMALNLSLGFVFDFPLLNLSARDRNNARRQLFESLEWCFGLFRFGFLARR